MMLFFFLIKKRGRKGVGRNPPARLPSHPLAWARTRNRAPLTGLVAAPAHSGSAARGGASRHLGRGRGGRAGPGAEVAVSAAGARRQGASRAPLDPGGWRGGSRPAWWTAAPGERRPAGLCCGAARLGVCVRARVCGWVGAPSSAHPELGPHPCLHLPCLCGGRREKNRKNDLKKNLKKNPPCSEQAQSNFLSFVKASSCSLPFLPYKAVFFQPPTSETASFHSATAPLGGGKPPLPPASQRGAWWRWRWPWGRKGRGRSGEDDVVREWVGNEEAPLPRGFTDGLLRFSDLHRARKPALP